MFKKIILSVAAVLLFQTASFGSELSSSINKIINSFDFERDSVVSVSVRDKKTGLPVYEKNAYKALNPASVLKVFTMMAALKTLGEDYSFDTAFYKDNKNNLYLKLSGDPLFTGADMNELAKSLKEKYKGKINKIFIDDSVMDLVSYPDGWTVDDFWPNSPKISPYMVDANTVKVDFYLNEGTKDIRIIQKSPYRFSFVNKLTIGDKDDINLVQDDVHNTVNVEGTISSGVVSKNIPVINPKYFYCRKMNDALNNNGIAFHDKFIFARVPNNAVLVAKFSRPIDDVIRHTLEYSDNTSAEMVFKVAGGKYAKETTSVKDEFAIFGTTQNGVNMFYEFYKGLGMDTRQVKVRDGSGVSRYNVANANWMTSALSTLDFDYKKYLPTSGVGTLKRRMREMEGSVYFKTGTLFGTSSLLGVVKSGEDEYCYSSIIMDYNRNKSLIKGVEDEIIYEIYRINENEEN